MHHSTSICSVSVWLSTHSQAEVPPLRGGDISADLGRLSEGGPLCDVTVSGGLSIKGEERMEAVNDAWQGDDHGHHQ